MYKKYKYSSYLLLLLIVNIFIPVLYISIIFINTGFFAFINLNIENYYLYVNLFMSIFCYILSYYLESIKYKALLFILFVSFYIPFVSYLLFSISKHLSNYIIQCIIICLTLYPLSLVIEMNYEKKSKEE
jgi:hypothetical protein